MWSLRRIGCLCFTLTCALQVHEATCDIARTKGREDSESRRKLRIFLEDFVFIKGETDIVKGIIAEENDLFELAGVATSNKEKGLAHNVTWDYLVTNRAGAKSVFRNLPLRRDQIVSITPGMDAITQKNALISNLWSAYGEGMSDIMPLSFALPEGLGMLQQYIEHATVDQLEEVWVLKENKHRGQGVTPVLLKDMVGKIMANYVVNKENENNKGKKKGKYVLAQKFIGSQMLIDDLPFTFRIWAIFGGGTNTVRGYLFDGSIIPFGDKPFTEDKNKPALARANDLMVNLFLQDRSKAKDPWSMFDLKNYLHGVTGNNVAFQQIWDSVQTSVAKTLAAAVPSIRKNVQNLKYYQEGNFEILGVDFILDTKMKPWLIEVNYLPSMSRKVIGCVKGISCPQSIFDDQKEKFLHGVLHILWEKQAHSDLHLIEAGKSLSANKGCSLPETLSAERLARILDMQLESKNAIESGFSSLNSKIYESLIATQKKDKSKLLVVLERLQRKVRQMLPRIPIVKMSHHETEYKQIDSMVHELSNTLASESLGSADQILSHICKHHEL